MKKLLWTYLLVFVAVFTCSCSSTEVAETEENSIFPTTENYNFVESKNLTELRFDMTLWEYTTRFNNMNSDKEGSMQLGISMSDWELLEEGNVDESGVEYDSYYFNSGKVVLTATVETKSQQIMNLGCGTTVEQFKSSPETQSDIMTVCGIMCAVAGGYNIESVDFFSNLFLDTFDSRENSFWYQDSMYILTTEEGDSDAERTMLFRTMPVGEELREQWSLVDYKTFYNNNRL